MFYCDECAENKHWPKTIGKSEGLCVFCKCLSVCNNKSSEQSPKAYTGCVDPMTGQPISVPDNLEIESTYMEDGFRYIKFKEKSNEQT